MAGSSPPGSAEGTWRNQPGCSSRQGPGGPGFPGKRPCSRKESSTPRPPGGSTPRRGRSEDERSSTRRTRRRTPASPIGRREWPPRPPRGLVTASRSPREPFLDHRRRLGVLVALRHLERFLPERTRFGGLARLIEGLRKLEGGAVVAWIDLQNLLELGDRGGRVFLLVEGGESRL